MAWLTENWFLVLFIVIMIGMHTFGHGGHGGHKKENGEKSSKGGGCCGGGGATKTKKEISK